MNLRDSYRTRPDMHDGFESLSFPPNVFSEVIDRRMNVPSFLRSFLRFRNPRKINTREKREEDSIRLEGTKRKEIIPLSLSRDCPIEKGEVGEGEKNEEKGEREIGPIGHAERCGSRFLDLARRAAAYGMQIIHNILFARIICRSGEAKKCARYVWSAYVLARRNWHGPRRSPPCPRVYARASAPRVRTRSRAHGRSYPHKAG